MHFGEWVEQEIRKRGWSQRELVRHAKNSSVTISSGQLSHIINGSRQAGPEACIAIAHALGVSREEAFRARGWLLREPEQVFEPGADLRLVQLAEQMKNWPPHLRDVWVGIMKTQADAIDMAVNQ